MILGRDVSSRVLRRCEGDRHFNLLTFTGWTNLTLPLCAALKAVLHWKVTVSVDLLKLEH